MARKTKYDLIVPPCFLYRYRPLLDEFSSLQQMLERDEWWFGSRKKFDDQKDMLLPGYEFRDAGVARHAIESVQDFLDKTGVLCLSRSPKHPKLWECYAAAGKGVCIKLESDYIVHPDNGPFRVNYSDDPRPLWRPFQGGQDSLKYLLQKERPWSYQGEWRCILKRNPGEKPTVGYHSMSEKRALAGVIFGWETTREDRLKILGWLINGGKWRRRVDYQGNMKLTLQESRLNGGTIELLDYRP